MDNEEIIRRAYQVAEDKDLDGWVGWPLTVNPFPWNRTDSGGS
jgi:hypothetical protein